MNAAKWIIALIIAGVAAYFIMQELENQTIKTEQSAEVSNMKKSYYSDGTIKAQVKIIEGKKEGKGYNYYPDGSVHSEINYKNNIKQGSSIWYFENGKPYRITPYKDGRRHGIQKKYYESGELLAEIPYKNGKLQPGTREYEKTGKQIDGYPEIIIKTRDNTKTLNSYDIDMKLSSDNKVEFEVVNLSNNTPCKVKVKNNGYQTIGIVSIGENNIGKKLLVSAKFRSELGNYILISKEYNLFDN